MFGKLIEKYLKEMPLIVAIAICGLLILYAYGCEPKTTSILYPTEKISRSQLENEFEYLINVHAQRAKDLDQQEHIRQVLFQHGLTYAQTGLINPIAIATTLFSVLGIGVAVDDVKLRKKIKKTNNNNT